METKYLAKALIKLSYKTTSAKASAKFLHFIQQKGLLPLLPGVVRYLKKELEMQKEMNTLKIYSSHTLAGQAIDTIKKTMKVRGGAGEEVTIEKDLIGGFRAEYDTMVYDASVKTQLSKLTAFLKEIH